MSKEPLRLLEEHGVEFDSINYYEQPLTRSQLRDLLRRLGLTARDLLRKDEPIAPELGINKSELSDGEIIDLMVEHPDLIQRPIVLRGDKAVLARPLENVRKLF